MPLASLAAASLAALAAAAVVIAAAATVAPRPAQATAAFAVQTKQPCDKCHVSPAGGKLTAYGVTFKANGNKAPGQ